MTDGVVAALLIFKPDAAYRLAPRAAIWRFLKNREDIRLKGLRWFHPPEELIQRHYDFLQSRPFFPWLVDFMSALPVVVGKIEADPPALERLRYDLGETRIQEARPGSIRERFGIYGGVNCLHVSDSPESGAKETELWSHYVQLEGLEALLGERSDEPDHTYRLRSLAAQVSAGVHKDLAAATILELLQEETDLIGEDLATFGRIILDAF
ncbi:MAG: hypothetical protein E6J02_12955 [Chloroflexi bacterium]|nr:MAG: hypothetical protein E6J02_12955 [Chloroflexota bacterium]TME16057.1 MAG: hypothetical protein E6I63_07765 [Chloroflexota bacterium]